MSKRLLIATLIITSLFISNFTIVLSQAIDSVAISSSGTILYISPLHIEGRYIKDVSGNTVILKGFQKHGFEDLPGGRWKTLDRNYWYFNEDAVRINLQEIKAWGANQIRVIDRAQYWIENTVDNSGKAHRDIIKRLIEMAAAEGIYVNYCLFSMDSSPGYHQLPWGTSLIPTQQDFVNLWVNIATELSVYNNVLFDLWNEVANDQDAWFDCCQQTVAAIRNVCDNIIVIQWNWDVWYRETDTGSQQQTMEWALDSRIQGSNILYSTHMYHDARGFYQPEGSSEKTYFFEYADIQRAFEAEMINWLLYTQNKPLYIGEFGPRHIDLPYPPSELTACDNALTILDNWGVSYSCMWWWPSGGGITGPSPNADDGNGCDWTNPTAWGEIVLDHLN
jgi:hypothetical protein